MSCSSCTFFVQDFLPFALTRDNPLTSKIREKSLATIAPELTTTLVRISQKLPKEEFEKAWKTSNQIARRGRPAFEYQALLLSATLNFLKFTHPWISSELSHIPCLLMEAGVVRYKDRKRFTQETWDFINYLIPAILQCIYEVHDDHLHPKGIQTNVGSILSKSKQVDESDKHTLYDKDDYMSEILNEPDDDLYT